MNTANTRGCERGGSKLRPQTAPAYGACMHRTQGDAALRRLGTSSAAGTAAVRADDQHAQAASEQDEGLLAPAVASEQAENEGRQGAAGGSEGTGGCGAEGQSGGGAEMRDEPAQIASRPVSARPGSAQDDLAAFFAAIAEGDCEEEEGADLDLVHGGYAPSEGPPSVVCQAAPLVLNLDDPYESSPVVLTMELERMEVDELEDFHARLTGASIAARSETLSCL